MKTLINPRIYGVFYALLKRVPLLVFAGIIIHACSDMDEIGLDLIDTRAQMHSLDTLTIKAMTIPGDSIAMNLGSNNILGIINDPVFGKTRASIYTETRLFENNLYLGDDPVLDSIHLVLLYAGDYYGDLETFQYLEVYELAENIPDVDSLFSNIEVPHHPRIITRARSGFYFQPAPSDSIMVDSIMRPPQIRIPLSDAFGQKFIDANGTETFENVPKYLETFKGLLIKPNENVNGKGAMYSINMLSTVTSIELFYHTVEEDSVITHMRRFPINEFAQRSTRIEHFGYEDANPVLREQILNENQAMADSLLFSQSLGMLRINIDIPFVDELTDIPRLLINQAKLVIPVPDEYVTEALAPTQNLILLRIGEEGDLNLLDDYLVGSAYFGGRFDKDNMQYTFNISKYFQQLLDGTYPNDGLALVTQNITRDMSRVVLNGPGNQENPMRLVLFYSVFD